MDKPILNSEQYRADRLRKALRYFWKTRSEANDDLKLWYDKFLQTKQQLIEAREYIRPEKVTFSGRVHAILKYFWRKRKEKSETIRHLAGSYQIVYDTVIDRNKELQSVIDRKDARIKQQAGQIAELEEQCIRIMELLAKRDAQLYEMSIEADALQRDAARIYEQINLQQEGK